MKHKFSVSLTLALIVAMLVTSLAVASDVDVAVVDVTVPLDAVTLTAGTSGPITINLTITGKQEGTATFEVYRNWTLSGGIFTGTNSQEFTVAPRAAGDPATIFSTTGSVIVDPAQPAGGPFIVTIGVFDITNTNATGAKLSARQTDTYSVTVSAPPPPSDTTPPVLTPNILGTLGDNGWYVSDVYVSWTVVDNESPLSSTSGCGITPINFDTAGTTSTCTATSAGGTSTQSVTIKRDAIAPTVSANPEPPANVNSWNNTDVTVSFSGTDALSGIDFCSAPVVLKSEGVGQSASGTCTDKAGNSADATASSINIDKTEPTASASASPAPNIEDWNNTDVTVSFDGFDTLSGIDFCDAAVVLSSEGAEQSASGTCTDKAGNVSAPATVSGINIDKTGPAISLLGGPEDGASYYFGFVPAPPSELEILVSDNLSGPYLVGLAGYGPEVGTHTMTVTAYDKAGNMSTLSRTYTVLAWTLNGFYQPVDMNGVWNTVKGGSTVPFKFEVFAGSIELTDTSVVSSFVAAPVACPASSVIADAIEFTTTGGTSLRYDSVAGQFINNWQTPKKPGACYIVTMTTQDGSTLSANFKLK